MNIADAIIGRAYAAETPAGEAAHGGGAFPPFDPTYFASQLLWLAITFTVFYFIMSRVAVPRIGSILETRRDRITQDLDEAQRLKDESDAAHAAYEHELATAKGRANSIAQEARDAAKAEAEAERQRIEQSLNERMAEAEAKIASIKAEALKEVDRIASDTTELIVQELIGAKATKAEIAAAIDAKP